MNEEREKDSGSASRDDYSRPAPYGPNTAGVRSFLVELNSLSARDWIVFTHEYRRRQEGQDLVRADAALASAVDKGALEDARDAVVGPVLQLANRVAGASDGATQAAGLEVDDLAEAALAGVLALMAAPLMDQRDVGALTAHLAPLLPSAVPGSETG
ncbi:MAG TPA: hypothetical protein VKZ41_01005 [Gemmatimonadales bacterium]|nr:hypothetical protein [Gemmatimonadales bacterium]